MAKMINDMYLYSFCVVDIIVESSAYLEEGSDAGGGPDRPVEVHIVRVVPS